MKAISIRQPWAYFICTGHKPVENRIWHTNYRGSIYIHASKTFDREGLNWIIKNAQKLGLNLKDIPNHFEIKYKLGAIIGKATLYMACRQHESPWFFGPWGFVFKDAELFSKPIPYKGQLGIFDVEGDFE